MIILVDFDDTISNTCEAWVKWLNSHYGTTTNIDDIHEWDMRKAFPTLTAEEIYEPLKNEIFWLTVTPKPDAIKYIPLIELLGNEIYFVTSTHPSNIKYKADMLRAWFPDIPDDRLIVSYNKKMIRGSIMIDDNILNLKNRDFSILFTAQHNRLIDLNNSSIMRFDNWKDIYEYIKSYF